MVRLLRVLTVKTRLSPFGGQTLDFEDLRYSLIRFLVQFVIFKIYVTMTVKLL